MAVDFCFKSSEDSPEAQENNYLQVAPKLVFEPNKWCRSKTLKGNGK